MADRIVPVQNIDLISLYSVVLKQDSNNSGLAKLNAVAPGIFEASTGSLLLAAEPVKSFDIKSSLTATKIYFVAAYDFEGFSLAGVKEEPTEGSAEVLKDATTLYSATLSSGDITIAKVGL